MRRYYIASGILLILPIIDFVLAAPVLVQEKCQAGVEVVHKPEDAIIILGKRGDELNELWLKFLNEDHFAKSEKSSAARPSSSSPPSWPADGVTDVEKPLPSNPEGWSPVSSPVHAPSSPGSLTGSGNEVMTWDVSPGPSSPASSSQSIPSPVIPPWFLTGHGFMGNEPQQFDPDHRLVVEEPPSRPVSPTELDEDHEYEAVHSPPTSPGSASPAESDYEMVDSNAAPSSPASSTNSDRRSMGTDVGESSSY